jgi:hypothetical protein
MINEGGRVEFKCIKNSEMAASEHLINTPAELVVAGALLERRVISAIFYFWLLHPTPST